MKTISEEKFDSLIKDCHLILKPIGFKKKGNNFFLQKKDFGQHINFQKGSFRTRDDISFTINTGIFLREYWSAMDYNKGKAIPDFPNGTDCILSRRIGQMKRENDTWWDVNESINISELAYTILQNIREVIIPYFNKIETKKELKEVINSQPYHGIPLYEKMIALGELGEIQNAQTEYDKLKNELKWNPEFLGIVDDYAKKYGLK